MIILSHAVSCVVNAANPFLPTVHSAPPLPRLKIFAFSHARAYCLCVLKKLVEVDVEDGRNSAFGRIER